MRTKLEAFLHPKKKNIQKHIEKVQNDTPMKTNINFKESKDELMDRILYKQIICHIVELELVSTFMKVPRESEYCN